LQQLEGAAAGAAARRPTRIRSLRPDGGGGPAAADRQQPARRAQAVASDFFAALGGSFTLGSAPAFNLARCLGQDPSLAAFSSA
jgi:hypothetical protein